MERRNSNFYSLFFSFSVLFVFLILETKIVFFAIIGVYFYFLVACLSRPPNGGLRHQPWRERSDGGDRNSTGICIHGDGD